MANNRRFSLPQNEQAVLAPLSRDTLQLIAGRYLSAKDSASLAQSCQMLWHPMQPVLSYRLLEIFLQKVVDDDRTKVRALIALHPWLLMAEPPQHMKVKSLCTWQVFKAENPLIMAVKRKQIEMIELLLSEFEKLEQTTEIKALLNRALSAWTFYVVRKNEWFSEDILIPCAYREIIKDLLVEFTRSSLPEGKLCDATEASLSLLYERLLPKQAIKLDNYLDIELLLYTAYKLFWDCFNDFQNWEQQDAFCIRVIGFIQSLLSPETAKIFCYGLFKALEQPNTLKSCETALPTLTGGVSFYRPSCESRAGLGFDFMVAVSVISQRVGLTEGHWDLVMLYTTKEKRFIKCSTQFEKQHNERSGCVLF